MFLFISICSVCNYNFFNNLFCLCRFSCLDIFPVTASENLSGEHPILLRPWEHYAFLFRIIYHENQMAFNKVLYYTHVAHNAIDLQGCHKVVKKRQFDCWREWLVMPFISKESVGDWIAQQSAVKTLCVRTYIFGSLEKL